LEGLVNKRFATGEKFIASRGWLDIFRVAAVLPRSLHLPPAARSQEPSYSPDFFAEAKSRANKTEGRWFKSIDTTKQKKSHTPNGVWDSFGLCYQFRCRPIFKENGLK